MSRILLVAPDREFAPRLTDAFGPAVDETVFQWWEPHLFSEPGIAAARISGEKPSVALFTPDDEVGVDKVLEVIDALTSSHPEIASVLLVEPTPDLFGRAMRSGVRDILDPGASSTVINERISELLGIADRLRATATAPAGPTGSVVTMLEPKGGSGKTSVLSNLAVLMAQKYPGEVVAIDLDLQFGDLSDALLLEPRYTIADVAKLPGNVDATTLKAFLTRRQDLFVLCAPHTPADADAVTPEIVATTVKLLQQEFTWVLIDTAAGLIEPSLTVLDHSTDLILLASLDAFSIRNLKKTIEIMDQLGIVVPARHLVLNRADSKVGLDRTEAIYQLGMRKATEVPSSRLVPTSLNRGEPVVEMQPRSPVSRRIADLAEELITSREQRTEWSST